MTVNLADAAGSSSQTEVLVGQLGVMVYMSKVDEMFFPKVRPAKISIFRNAMYAMVGKCLLPF